MKYYIEEHQVIANPFTPRSYPSKPNPSPFTKWPKATTEKRNTMATSPNIERPAKPRNQQNWLTPSQEIRSHSTGSHRAIPTQQVGMSFTFTQLATASAVHTQPLVTIPNQTQPRYCAAYTPSGKKCPTTYPIPLDPG